MHFSMYACTGKTAPAFISHYFAMHICREFDEVKLKFGYSEKATKFEKIFHLKFDATQ